MFLAEVSVMRVTHLRQVIAIDGQMAYVLDIYWFITVLPHQPMKHGLVSHTESYIYIVGSTARCRVLYATFRNVKWLQEHKCRFYDFVRMFIYTVKLKTYHVYCTNIDYFYNTFLTV